MHARHMLLAAVALTALPIYAQSPKDAGPLYRVEIHFRDSNDAAAATDRRYSMLVMDSHRTSFKVGSKSPAVSGTIPQQSGTPAATQFTYLDVGVNIECKVQSVGTKIAMEGSLDLSNIAGDANLVSGVREPVIRQTKLNLDAVMDLGKPMILASIDDPITARKLQIEATVSKID